MDEEETLRRQKCFLLLFHSPNYTENHSAARAPKYASLMINNTAFNSCIGSITHIYHPQVPLVQLRNRYYMVISQMGTSGAAKNSYYMVIFSKLTSAAQQLLFLALWPQ